MDDICSIEDCGYRSVTSDGLCLAHFRAKAKPAVVVAAPAVEPEEEPSEAEEAEAEAQDEAETEGVTSRWWHKDEG